MITMNRSKYFLGSVWLIGFLIPFLLLTIQTIGGTKYLDENKVDRVGDVWAWFLPTVLPTLSLMIGVFIVDAANQSLRDKDVSPFIFVLAVVFSLVYLSVLSLMFILNHGDFVTDPAHLKQSSLFLGPLQGLVSGLIGVFFVNKKK
jgi:hypothetical protein